MNKNNLHYIALLLLILLIAGISLANMQPVTVNFLLVQFKIALDHSDLALCPLGCICHDLG